MLARLEPVSRATNGSAGQTNSKLDELIQSNVLGDASNLIGKQITSSDGQTTGTVQAVVLADNGIFAELADGQKVPVISGTRITEDGGAAAATPQQNEDPSQSALY